MNLKEIKLKRNVDLKPYTTIKIGGCAKDFFFIDNIDDLYKIINHLGNNFHIIGGGSNLLVKDGVINKPVIKLGRSFDYIKNKDSLIEAGAATPFPAFMKYCMVNNLQGLENLAGIPATIGGLLATNASSYGRSISDCLYKTEVMDNKGKLQALEREKMEFGYRFSSLKGSVILRAWFKLSAGKNLKDRIKDFFQKRLATQDFGYPSCGCIFKNSREFSAGFLIDSCGFKGRRENQAQVSLKHANFIVNVGNAVYNDVDCLINKIRDKVRQKYDILLEEEIERWDE